MKKQPALKNASLKRIFYMPLAAFYMLIYSHLVYVEYSKELIKTYLDGITDNEITNFDALYSQLKA